VFAGSVNAPVGGYLRDPTGARRFWPVACHGRIDLHALEGDRAQLWAEAVHRFNAGEKWWLEGKLEKLAAAEQAARFIIDAWEEPIREWLGDDKNDVAISEVLRGAIELERWSQADQNRVQKVLTHLGFRLYKANRKGQRQERYQRAPQA
jgi:predicted P-loop ATPase